MPVLRTPPSGPVIAGTAPGDVLIWTPATQEWLPGPGGGGGAIVPLSRTVFVDRTSTAVGPQDGSIAHPFLSIGAALTAIGLMGPGPASILVGPGTYTELVTLPDRDGFVLQGSGPGTTILVAPALAPSALRYAPAPGSTTRRLDVRGMTARCTVGQRCVDVSSSTFAPLTLLADGLYFDEVNCEPDPGGISATIVGIGNCYVTDSAWASSTALGGAGTEQTQIRNCTTFLSLRSRIGDLQTDYDDALPAPGSGRSIYQIDDSTQIETRWTITGHPICAASPGTLIRGPAVGLSLDATGLTNGATHSPILAMSCGAGVPTVPGSGAVSIVVPDQTAPPAGPAVVVFSGATFLGTLLASVAAGLVRFRAFATGCSFLNPTPGAITAGNKMDLDVRGSDYPVGTLAAAGDGAIDRSFDVIPVVAVLPGPNAIPIVPPLPPAVAGLYVVWFEEGSPVPSGGTISIPFAGKLDTGFSAVLGGAVPTGGNFTVFRP